MIQHAVYVSVLEHSQMNDFTVMMRVMIGILLALGPSCHFSLIDEK